MIDADEAEEQADEKADEKAQEEGEGAEADAMTSLGEMLMQKASEEGEKNADETEEVGEEDRGEGAASAMPTKRSGSSATANMPAEANREAAEEWLRKARAQHESGDDTEATRLLEKSLKLCELAAARSLQDHIRKYGAGSAAAVHQWTFRCLSLWNLSIEPTRLYVT